MPLAAALLCTVIGISDGDTLTVRCKTQEGLRNIKVRLAEIDAPEKQQPWGQRSRQSLAALCCRQPAEVRGSTTDRNGRLVSHVACNGADSSSEQVRAGMAWVYDRYVEDWKLYDQQQQARTARLGLWQDDSPVPPWTWRLNHRPARQGETAGQAYEP